MPAHYVTRKKHEDPDFRQRFDEAWQLGLQAMEDKAQEFAFKGIRRDVYYQGSKVGEQWEPSERLVEFYLKANKPDKYRENGMVFNMGANSLVTVLSGMPRSDAIEMEKEVEALEVKQVEALEAPKVENGATETRPPDTN